jgi:hypothetical protein
VIGSSKTAAAVAMFATAAVTACTQRPVPEIDFAATPPAVAAEYRTTVTTAGDAHRSTWRFWRESDRVVSENLADGTGEQWQLDGRTLFHQQLFHEARHGIEFQSDDLRMLEALPAWGKQTLLVDPGVLAVLEPTGAGWRSGYPYRRYTGRIGGVRWDVTLRADLMLPTVIEREERGVRQRTELLEVYALADAPWQPTPTDGYRILDFADLGDHERDPFVMDVQRRLGLEHTHHPH